MPEISRFYGIIIRMYVDDHPPAHFHAFYNEYEALIAIDNFRIIAGNLPPKALGLIMEWASEHHDELKEEWKLAQAMKPLFSIEPLK